MARLVGLLVALCQATATAGSPGLWEAVVGLADGFLADGLLEGCVRDSKRAVGGFDAAVSDLEQGGAVHTLKGLKELADSLRGVPDVLRECKAAEEDVKQAVDALAQLRDPREFAFHVGKNLVVNHRDIYAEITGAVTAYKAQQYLRFGLDVGTALRKLVVGVEEQFLEFERLHNKTYHSPQERESRLAIFANNLDEIFDLGRVEQGTAVYSHLTPFADMTPEEFSARLGLKATGGEGADAPLADALETSTLPDSFDWRAKGAVNPVKNQEQCGSCWAFATVANIEGAGFVSTGRLVSLSEQELVDCDHQTGDQGCGGGLPSNAFKDMIQQQLGLELEAAYPYAAKDGTCRASASSEVAFIGGWKQVSQDEDQIAAALVQYGPLAIGINAGPMQWYFGGIAHPWRLLCNPTKLDHGVAIVAFGAQGTKKYWTIRNSWGPSWGEQGYYRIVRGAGACGLNTMVTTATGVTIKSAARGEFVV